MLFACCTKVKRTGQFLNATIFRNRQEQHTPPHTSWFQVLFLFSSFMVGPRNFSKGSEVVVGVWQSRENVVWFTCCHSCEIWSSSSFASTVETSVFMVVLGWMLFFALLNQLTASSMIRNQVNRTLDKETCGWLIPRSCFESSFYH